MQDEEHEDLSIFNVNFIAISTILYGRYLKFYNAYVIDLGKSMIDFLNESIQGPCPGNQKTLLYNRIDDITRDLMHELNNESNQLQVRGIPEFKTTDVRNISFY